jgi:hypothetical protein
MIILFLSGVTGTHAGFNLLTCRTTCQRHLTTAISWIRDIQVTYHILDTLMHLNKFVQESYHL